jgi:hypothetical protein
MHVALSAEESARPIFRLGRLLATPGVLAATTDQDRMEALQRYLLGDWGDVDDHDKAANDSALHEGTRILGVYHSQSGTKFWIITEANRSSTTILLPEEY